MNSDLLKARILEAELSTLSIKKEKEIETLMEKFVFSPKHSPQKSLFKFYLNLKDEICFFVSERTHLYKDDLGEFFAYIDKIKAEYHNFLKDKEQGI